MFSAAVGAEPRIAIIIDDLGEQYAASHSAMKLPVPVAFAFLPNGGHTPGLARVAAERGLRVVLMERDAEAAAERAADTAN